MLQGSPRPRNRQIWMWDRLLAPVPVAIGMQPAIRVPVAAPVRCSLTFLRSYRLSFLLL